MNRKRKLQVGVIVSILFLTFAILIFAPKLPSNVANKQSTAKQRGDKLTKALSLVQHDGNPMEGIMMLKEIVEENPDNAEAHWYLGHFSVESGQYDKAIMRFQKVIELDEEHFNDAYFYLGKTYATIDSVDLALVHFKKYRELATDSIIINGVDRFIRELETLK